MPADHPDPARDRQRAAAAVEGISAALADGDLAAAVRLAAEAREAFPRSLAVGLLGARAHAAAGDAGRAVQLATEMMDAHPAAVGPHRALAQIHVEQGRLAEAAEGLQRAQALHPEDLSILRLRALVAERAQDWAVAVETWKRLAELAEDESTWLGKLAWATAQKLVDEGEGAEVVMALAALDDPEARPAVLMRHAKAALEVGHPDIAAPLFRRVGLDPGTSARRRRISANHLLKCGANDAAIEVLEALADEEGYDGYAASKLRILRDHSAAFDPDAPPPTEVTEDGDVAVYRRPDSDVAILVFRRLIEHTGLPHQVRHQILARHGTNIVYLGDRERIMFLRGVRSLGGTYEATAAALRARLAEWGIQRLVCTGGSTGAFAAVRYGIELGARAVLATSPATRLTAEMAALDPRASVMKQRTLSAGLGGDLREMLEAAPDPPRVVVYYPEEETGDRLHAEWLAGLPTVALRPIRNWPHHDVAMHLVDTGEYEKAVAELLTT